MGLSRRKFAKASRAGQKGATAVEFAIVAPVFLALMLSTFEVGWFYFVNSSVDAAATNVARMIRTGQAQKAGYKSQAHRDDFLANEVCPLLAFLGDCDTKITAEVRTFASFAALAADNTSATCRDAQQTDINNIAFNPGVDRSIVHIRICLIYRTLNPAIGMSLAKSQSGDRKVTASQVLRVEPFTKAGGV